MDSGQESRTTPPMPGPRPLRAGSALMLTAWFGLVVGYLDLGMIFVKRDVFHASMYYEQGRHFHWVVPLSNLVVLMLPGLLLAAVCGLRPGRIPARLAAWLLGTLALWGPLLRAPIHGAAGLLLAAGAARLISRGVVRDSTPARWAVRISLAALLIVLAGTAGASLWRERRAESRALTQLPAPWRGARNVLLLVMDTVRAENLGLYGYARDTTPNLARWAERGILFNRALAPAPWTFPSHCSLLTGQWPSTLNVHWQPTLDAPFPTLAEVLATRGYLTAGFAANTRWCTYESRLDRGFAHYEDYTISPSGILASTPPGRWLLTRLLWPGSYYGVKWIGLQSRDARAINRAFLDWLNREQGRNRPFFAFLNYMDAHEPFLPPDEETVAFGLRPESAEDYGMLVDYWDRNKLKITKRDVTLARDCYDTCIGALDRQVGALLDDLGRRGILRNTLVIVTSDHGEEFGEHRVFNHGYSVYAHAVRVPLVVLDPSAPAGRTVSEPVSLRDLPATVMDMIGDDRGDFPGRSLASCWRSPPSAEPPPLAGTRSEVYIPDPIGPERGRGPAQREYTVSLMSGDLHYVVDVRGVEELYDLARDPRELRNLKNRPNRSDDLQRFRDSLLRVLPDSSVPQGIARESQDRMRAKILSVSP
jgi:arylsulfatase A-like enzyme